MARKFLTPIDLGKLELQNARIQNLSTANQPANPVAGQIYFDTTDHVLKTWDGSAWITSNQGIQGVQGTLGSQGTQGTVGSQGVQGTLGSQGTVGSQGTQGTDGIQGLDGADGAQGLDGNDGAQGTQGTLGAQGTVGTQGVQGTLGSQGVQGSEGTQGTQGTDGSQGVQGTEGAQGTEGSQGTVGADGSFGGVTVEYATNASTTMADPGSGTIRFDAADTSTATHIAIDVEDVNAFNLASYLQTIDDSTSTIKGHVKISVKTDTATFGIWAINSMVDNSGWYNIDVTPLSGSGNIPDGSDVLVTFARTGDIGAQGVQGTEGSQGVQGTVGSQGTQGTLGAQGTQGVQGVQGVEGAQGTQGTQGTEGTQGTQGTQGTDGTQGVQGSEGAQGTQGTDGTQGVQGSEGTQGVQGTEGQQGVQGTEGSQGTQGTLGAQGTQGTEGAQGLEGSQGAQGAEGSFGGVTVLYNYDNAVYVDDATDNPSSGNVKFNNAALGSSTVMAIHEEDLLAVQLNNYLQTIDDSTSTIKGHLKVSQKSNPAVFALYAINTLTEFDAQNFFEVGITFLSGIGPFYNGDDVLITFARTGDVGSQGTQGTDGAQGVQGTEGAQGVQGTLGAQGTQGTQGVQGVEGVQGVQGTEGAQGVQGTEGSQGTQGTDGTQGAQGTEGQQGTQGTDGTQGVQGTEGTQGTQGTDGTQGTQGTEGAQGVQGTEGTQGTQGTEGAQGVQGTEGAQGTEGHSDRYKTTSGTDYTIVGADTNVSFVLDDPDLSYSVGQDVVIAYDVSNHMSATVVSYTSGTNTLVVNINDVVGSGFHGDWTVNLDGATGVQGTTGSQGTQGTDGTQGIQGTEGAQGTSGQLGTYATTITGDSTDGGATGTTSFPVTHALGTEDIMVTVWDTSTKMEVVTDVAYVTTTSVTIGFAVAPLSTKTYRVVVKA